MARKFDISQPREPWEILVVPVLHVYICAYTKIPVPGSWQPFCPREPALFFSANQVS